MNRHFSQTKTSPFRRSRTRFIGTTVLASSFCLAWSAAQSTPTPATLPEGAGRPIVQRACTSCHNVRVVTSKKGTHSYWSKTVDDMVNRGAELSDEEIGTVVEYLAVSFPSADGKNDHSSSSNSDNK